MGQTDPGGVSRIDQAFEQVASTVAFVTVGVLINKLSDFASPLWTSALGVLAVVFNLVRWIRRRPEGAPVVSFTAAASAVVAVAGLCFAAVKAPELLQRIGMIAAIAGLMIIAFIAPDMTQVVKRLNSLALYFLGGATVATGAQIHRADPRTGWYLLVTGALVLLTSYPPGKLYQRRLIWLLDVIPVLAVVLLPFGSWMSPLAAGTLFAASLALAMVMFFKGSLWPTPLVTFFGVAGSILAFALVKKGTPALNITLGAMTIGVLLMVIAELRGRLRVSSSTLLVFAVATIATGVATTGLTPPAIGATYVAMGVAIGADVLFRSDRQLMAIRRGWRSFIGAAPVLPISAPAQATDGRRPVPDADLSFERGPAATTASVSRSSQAHRSPLKRRKPKRRRR